MIDPPKWTAEELDENRALATEAFRRQRMEEPLDEYVRAFDECAGSVSGLLKTTEDLGQIDQSALQVLTDRQLLEAFRYLAGPPISKDDLKTVAEAASLAPGSLRKDPGLVDRVVHVILLGMDRRRFPWVVEKRRPTKAERHAATVASAALMAAQRTGTKRRNLERKTQESAVEAFFLAANLVKVPARTMQTVADAPSPGQFCRESLLGGDKADFAIRLWDYRVMPLECKASNSAVNSVKRLIKEAAGKAAIWRHNFGAQGVVPCAVLSGVYKLHNLVDAQSRGLTIFWAHRLEALTQWIEKTRGP